MTVRASRLLGAERVIAARRNQEVLQALGADAAIDLRLPAAELKQAFAREIGRALQVAVDFICGPVTEALIETLAQSDLTAAAAASDLRAVEVGSMAGATIALPGGSLRGARLTILGSAAGNFPPPERMRAIIDDVLARAAKGEIAVETAIRPLSAVADAWAAPDDGRRVVLTV